MRLLPPHSLPRGLACALCLALWPLAGAAEDLLSVQMVEEARMWHGKGRLDLAADTWRRLLITNPQHGEALLGLARIQLQTGHLAEAEALLARAARLARKPTGYAQLAAAVQAAKARPEASAPATAKPTAAAPVAAPLPPQQPPRTANAAAPAPQAAARPDKAPAPSTPPKAGVAAPRPAPAPVPPPSTEVQITPIPFRTVETRDIPPAQDEDKRTDGVQLRSSNQLLLGNAPRADTPPATRTTGSPPKNKPRPYRPAPALSPPLPE